MMDFSNSDFSIKTFTSTNFFEFLNWITTFKSHVHHSQVTEKIHGYGHDFCNQKISENQNFFPYLVHNFFVFDFYLLLDGIRLTAWKTKNLNIEGTNLTNINFAKLR